MSKKLLLLIIPIIVIVLGIGGFFAYKTFSVPQKTHYHAGFEVFENNKKLDFSDTKYMFLEPCVLNSKHQDSPADIQTEKAHLHDNVGDVVHIERTGAVWKDLFTNMRFPIDYSKATGYINGKQTANFQNQPIKPDDVLMVFIGKNDLSLLKEAPTKKYIEETADKSTTCGE